ncbi:MAG: UDP-N-acetylmuramoyl-tripeptide--D-alanyl-D-alanine ligase [Clostridia bacterium]|nr:UDP-N-acetylmuramoyl-tripeptide--D-alanyl-D-alanine ligase [Clostridia bacterium]
MIPMTFKETAQAVKSSSTLEGSYDCICTDTRKITPGCLFIAIKGENFDGHDFAAKAVESGAKAVICEKDCGLGDSQILVENTRLALLDLAGHYRSKFNIPVIGITGSVGKTTTKEMTHAVMSSKYNTLKNEGNLNNEIGVPLTLFRLDETHEAAVIEMGMSGFDEISRMTKAVRPDVAIISNIGVSHIEKLGSREGILKAKLEILHGMKEDAPLILNGDDDMLVTADAGVHPVIYYGVENVNSFFKAFDITSKQSETEMSVGYTGGSGRVSLPFPGRHNVYNALAAVAAGMQFGINVQDGLNALKNYVPAGMRQRINKKCGITFIEDCYNASPDSQAAALAVLAGMNAERTVAVIGDMLELGDVSRDAHYGVGKKAAENNIDAVFTYGERSLETAKGACDGGVAYVRSFDDKNELSKELSSYLREGDAVLFKASRGMKLEDVIYSVYETLE